LSEFSIIASRRSKLRQNAADKLKGAKQAIRLHEDPDRFLATIQVGITLVGTIAGVFGGATLVDKLRVQIVRVPIELIAETSVGIAVAIVAIAITITAVVVGELVPKYIALSNPERYARLIARPISFFVMITSIFSSALSSISNLIVKIMGLKKNIDPAIINEDEINQMIFDGRQKGVFDAIEEKLIRSVFDFADSTARRAMTPRTDVVGLAINIPQAELIRIIIEEGYSRFPIYEGNIDNVIGILYTKDIIRQKVDPDLIILKDMLRKPVFVPDSIPLSTLLNEFQKKKNHIAIVLDDFGGTAGIITIEDILEELVGEIQDEYDQEQSPLIQHSDTVVYADSQVWPGEVNNMIGTILPEDDFNTLAGMIIDHLGHIPSKKQKIRLADVEITILSQEDNRLIRLKVTKTSSQKPAADKKEN
jgi:putative hemolysin